VHGKGSLLDQMTGDIWQRFANLRLLYGYMWTHPGKKLLFMGGEFGQWNEWNHESSLDWHLLNSPYHGELMRWVGDLNHFMRTRPALHKLDFSYDGFQWVDGSNSEESVIGYLRRSPDNQWVLVVCNFTPVPRDNYRLGVPVGGYWREALNSDARIYGGSGMGNMGGVEAAPIASHGHFHSVSLLLPPYSVALFEPQPP
jgi:1,4-alpha-glucan branching enzyme